MSLFALDRLLRLADIQYESIHSYIIQRSFDNKVLFIDEISYDGNRVIEGREANAFSNNIFFNLSEGTHYIGLNSDFKFPLLKTKSSMWILCVKLSPFREALFVIVTNDNIPKTKLDIIFDSLVDFSNKSESDVSGQISWTNFYQKSILFIQQFGLSSCILKEIYFTFPYDPQSLDGFVFNDSLRMKIFDTITFVTNRIKTIMYITPFNTVLTLARSWEIRQVEKEFVTYLCKLLSEEQNFPTNFSEFIESRDVVFSLEDFYAIS